MTEEGLAVQITTETRGRSRAPIARYVGRRILAGLLTLVAVSILTFVGTELLAGNIATAILGRNATPAAVAQVRQELHLNEPAYQRYADWAEGLATGNLGHSAAGVVAGNPNAEIWPLVSSRLLNSAILALVTVLALVPFGLTLGVLSALRARRALDHTVTVTSLVAISVPEFVTGTALILVFATWLNVLPSVSFVPAGGSVFDNPRILVLPVLTLLAASLAQTVRMVRAGMLEVMASQYIQMARINGFSERRIVVRYALRNALAPTVQVIALNIQWLVGGIVVTEYIFGYPGIGGALVSAVDSRDVTFVQSVVMLIAAFYIGVNIVADIVTILLIPKLRTAL